MKFSPAYGWDWVYLFRGRSWQYAPRSVRRAIREWYPAEEHEYNVSFRAVWVVR